MDAQKLSESLLDFAAVAETLKELVPNATAADLVAYAKATAASPVAAQVLLAAIGGLSPAVAAPAPAAATVGLRMRKA